MQTRAFSTTVAVTGYIIPPFWLGILLIILFAVYLHWLPSSGYESWKHFILPTLTGGTATTAILARYARSGMLEVLNQDYIRTARAKGLAERVVIVRHAFRNGMITLITITVPAVATILGGSILIENVFAWPGIGRMLLDGVLQRNFPVVQAAVIASGFFFIITALIIDILYAYVDPRIRYTQ